MRRRLAKPPETSQPLRWPPLDGVQRARLAIIEGELRHNWYRIANYETLEQAEPAIANVAKEIADQVDALDAWITLIGQDP